MLNLKTVSTPPTNTFDPKRTIPEYLTSPFIVNTIKCREHTALNFGHGAPDFELSKIIKESTEKALEALETEANGVEFSDALFN